MHWIRQAHLDPELMIRTSGEERISNFLLWQIAYSEFFFSDTLWPDFDKRNWNGQFITIRTENAVLAAD